MSSEIDLPPPYIGYSMRVVWLWVWELNVRAAMRAGYDDVTPAHISLFRYPGLDGHRLTDIAQRMQITKQSVHELIGHLERLGYLVREPDPTNRRARLVRLTPRGRGLQEVIRLQAQSAERQIAVALGDRPFAQLKKALAVLVDQITAGDHERGPNAGATRGARGAPSAGR
ncbi:MAG: MarR family winged helix-turn-helix transcriptional regulator [Candidatus Limnocylindrales bacterium]